MDKMPVIAAWLLIDTLLTKRDPAVEIELPSLTNDRTLREEPMMVSPTTESELKDPILRRPKVDISEPIIIEEATEIEPPEYREPFTCRSSPKEAELDTESV